MNWIFFVGGVLGLLAVDLGVFHRRAAAPGVREAIGWTAVWAVLALVFGFWIAPALTSATEWGHEQRAQFFGAWVIEMSLSMDNVCVIALIFGYFGLAVKYQHRVLFWGIVGAMLLRGLLIAGGAAVIARFSWVLYGFALLLLWGGWKMTAGAGEPGGVDPEKNLAVRWARRFFEVSPDYDGQNFTTWVATPAGRRRVLTPLCLVLLTVETTDVVFALDSIPASFAITPNAFVVFTANIFAVLGLRSLYFLLAEAVSRFERLKYALCAALWFIGGKMLVSHWIHLRTDVSLLVVGGILAVGFLASWWGSAEKVDAGMGGLTTEAQRAQRGGIENRESRIENLKLGGGEAEGITAVAVNAESAKGAACD